MFIQNIIVKSVNTFCKWQPFFVILNCVTSDGVRHPLNFLKNEKHLNVVLSRAEDDLIIINSKEMI